MSRNLLKARKHADAVFRATELRHGRSWHEDDPWEEFRDAPAWWYAGLAWVRELIEAHASTLARAEPDDLESDLKAATKAYAIEAFDAKLRPHQERSGRYTDDYRAEFAGWVAYELRTIISDTVAVAWDKRAARLRGKKRSEPGQFGAKMRAAMKTRGLSFDALADKTGMGKKGPVEIAHGRRTPHPQNKQLIAEVLGVPLADLDV